MSHWEIYCVMITMEVLVPHRLMNLCVCIYMHINPLYHRIKTYHPSIYHPSIYLSSIYLPIARLLIRNIHIFLIDMLSLPIIYYLFCLLQSSLSMYLSTYLSLIASLHLSRTQIKATYKLNLLRNHSDTTPEEKKKISKT